MAAVRNQRKRVKSESRAAVGNHFFRRNPVLPSSVAIMERLRSLTGSYLIVTNHDRDSKWGLILFSCMVTGSASTRLLDQMCPALGLLRIRFSNHFVDASSDFPTTTTTGLRPVGRMWKKKTVSSMLIDYLADKSQIERKRKHAV
jgi:hypothetical protein